MFFAVVYVMIYNVDMIFDYSEDFHRHHDYLQYDKHPVMMFQMMNLMMMLMMMENVPMVDDSLRKKVQSMNWIQIPAPPPLVELFSTLNNHFRFRMVMIFDSRNSD